MQPRRVQSQKTVSQPQHVLTQPTVTELQPVPVQQDVPDIKFFLLLFKLKHNCKLKLYSIRSVPLPPKKNKFVLGEKGLSDNNKLI
jgi:hypothetical protein